MQAKERQELIDKISNLDDHVLLDEIRKLIEISSEESLYELSNDQLTSVAVAEEQIKYGKTISHEDAKKQTNKWLEK